MKNIKKSKRGIFEKPILFLFMIILQLSQKMLIISADLFAPKHKLTTAKNGEKLYHFVKLNICCQSLISIISLINLINLGFEISKIYYEDKCENSTEQY